MKNLLIAALLFASVSCFGQGAPNITVRNATACTVYYRLSLTGSSNPCLPAYNSSVISIPPFSYVSYTNATYPGAVAGALNFVSAVVLNGGGACTSSGVQIGDPCNYTTLGSLAFLTAAPACSFCANATVEWLTGGYPTTTALVFY